MATTTKTITGTSGKDRINGTTSDEILIGLEGADTIIGGGGNDIYKYTSFNDSTQQDFDRIRGFDLAKDKIDLSDLGYTGLNFTTTQVNGQIRVIYSSSTNITYLKDGVKNVLIALDGDYLNTITKDNFIFAGSSNSTTSGGGDTTSGGSTGGTSTGGGTGTTGGSTNTSGYNVVTGTDGKDRLNGTSGNDVVIGLAGADTIIIDEGGNDIVRYKAFADSTQQNFDSIRGFDVANDKIDLSALGYTGLNYTTKAVDGQVRVIYSSTTNTTYLKDEPNNFLVAISGNIKDTLTNNNFIFAGNDTTSGSGDTTTGGGDTTTGGGSDTTSGGGASTGGGTSSGGNTGSYNTVIGSSGTDRINGTTGNDVIIGLAGADTIIMDQGGSDVVKYNAFTDSALDGYDRIRGFDVANDKFDLSALGYNGLNFTGSAVEGQVRVIYSSASNTTYLKDEPKNFLVAIEGNVKDTLTKSNFIFAGDTTTGGGDTTTGGGDTTTGGGSTGGGTDTTTGGGSTGQTDLFFFPTLGQSNARGLRIYGGDDDSGLSVLEDTFSALSGKSVISEVKRDGSIVDFAVGGSHASGMTTFDGSNLERAWWYTDANKPGPSLPRAIDLLKKEIAGYRGDNQNVKMTMIWGQGEADGSEIAEASSANRPRMIAEYEAALNKIFDALHAALDVDFDIIIMKTGRINVDGARADGLSEQRIADRIYGHEAVRAVQDKIAEYRSDVKVGVDYRDLPMARDAEPVDKNKDYLHISYDSYEEVGRRLGEFIGNQQGFNFVLNKPGNLPDVTFDEVKLSPKVVSFSGNAWEEVIIGSNLNDTITGNGGADTIISGAGKDTFIYKSANDSNGTKGIDLIYDFQQGQDKVNVHALGFTDIGGSASTSLKVAYDTTQDVTHVTNQSTGFSLDFEGDLSHTLDNSSFIF